MNARRVGRFLALWSIGFAVVHVAWAVGWRAGVPEDSPPISERPVFLAYDLVAGGLMFAAGLVALVLTREDLSPRVRGRLLTMTLIGSVLALLRGLPALAWDIRTAAPVGVGLLADIWFVVAGFAGLALWRVGRVGEFQPRPRTERRA